MSIKAVWVVKAPSVSVCKVIQQLCMCMAEEVGSVVRSGGCLACCARRVYWNVNYFGVIRAIAMARAVVGHRERAVPVACWPSTIYSCSYELLIGLTTSLKTIDGDCW